MRRVDAAATRRQGALALLGHRAERELHGYITNLYVRTEHRDAGLGATLLGAALAECEAKGVDAALLWPTTRSLSLYERHGFAAAGDLLERRLAPAPLHRLDAG